MLGTLKDINDAAFKGVDILNPFISKMDEVNKEIATALLDAGYDVKQIQNFIDVSRTQFDEWAEVEVEVRKRVAAANPPEVTEPIVEKPKEA